MMNQVFTAEQLNALPKETLVLMTLQLSDSFQLLEKQSRVILNQNEALLKQVADLSEQITILTNRMFGRKSEKNTQISGQLSWNMDDPSLAINEAEALVEEGFPEEPGIGEVVEQKRKRTPRPKGKRTEDLKDIHTTREDHYLSDEELKEKFPDGWKQLEDEVYTELKRIPESYEAVEHHIGVYAGKGKGDTVIRGKAPNRLLSHSILTPSLAASVFTAKYINAIPLNRLSEWYSCNGVTISRQVLAGWIIRLYEYYLEPVHGRMKEELFHSHVINCDETPFKMTGEKRKKIPKARTICGYIPVRGRTGAIRYSCMSMITAPGQLPYLIHT